MDTKTITTISDQIYRRFPELEGTKPTVRLQPSPHSKSIAIATKYLLTYRGSATSPEGATIPRLVRVIATAQGKIIKITTSR